jgi:amino acid transporter
VSRPTLLDGRCVHTWGLAAYLVGNSGHGVQSHPNGYIDDATKPVVWTVWAPKGTTFVQGVSALLNIIYTFTGQALIPSFVGDMKNPEDFPKALYISMSVEVLLFTVCGAVVYKYAGGSSVCGGSRLRWSRGSRG